MDSGKFYDEFINYQIKTGINERIYTLYKMLLEWGLKPDDNVLEIGCGIGCLSYLLLKKIKNGSLEALDISKKSIDYAKKHIQQKNASFTASDVFHYEFRQKSYDKILLFDVLEHIPPEDYEHFFEQISSLLDGKSLFFIHIPNPNYLEYLQKHQAESLQEIDEAVHTATIVKNLERVDLEIIYFKTYGIYVEDDYNFIVIRRKQEFKVKHLHLQRNLTQKAGLKLSKLIRNWKYQYPKQ